MEELGGRGYRAQGLQEKREHRSTAQVAEGQIARARLPSLGLYMYMYMY